MVGVGDGDGDGDADADADAEMVWRGGEDCFLLACLSGWASLLCRDVLLSDSAMRTVCRVPCLSVALRTSVSQSVISVLDGDTI